MLFTSLAVIALSASAAVPQLSKLVHLHPRHAETDTRVSLTLHNASPNFEDILVGGRTYTIPAHQHVTIKAPIGTKVFANNNTMNHHRGDLLVELDAQQDGHLLDLK